MNTPATLNLGEIDSRVLIFGGPYSNLSATQAMLAQAEKLSIPPQRTICTGDIVAYCAEPEQTSQLIINSGIHVVMGNCEESLAENSNDCGCGFEEGMLCSTFSESWYRYAQSQVSRTTRCWMKELPRSIRFSLNGRSCCVIHGSYNQINQFIFASNDSEIKRQQLLQAKTDIMIGGHCGLPFGQQIDNSLWLNAGVIGLPANDATVDGWYMLMEPEQSGLNISWHRLSYDYLHCQQAMKLAGLQNYTDTITSGIWPSMDVLPPEEKLQQGKPLIFEKIHLPDI
jgi:predicted phosphodiesterase